MKKKLKEIFRTVITFGVLTYLGQNTYLLEWLARRYFCFIWVPILLFWLFKQDILARWLTFGAFSGLFLGQIMEDTKWYLLGTENQAAHSSYWGVGIWFTTIIAAFGIGILHTWIKTRNPKTNAST